MFHELESGGTMESFYRVYHSLREVLTPEDQQEVLHAWARALEARGATTSALSGWSTTSAA
jgi:hypothetical protein